MVLLSLRRFFRGLWSYLSKIAELLTGLFFVWCTCMCVLSLFHLGCLQLIKFIIMESPIGACFRPSRLSQHLCNQYFDIVLLQYFLFQLNSSLRHIVVYFCVLSRISSPLKNLLKSLQMFHVVFILKNINMMERAFT